MRVLLDSCVWGDARDELLALGQAARQQGRAIAHVLGSRGNELAAGALITAEPGRLRVPPAAEGTGP